MTGASVISEDALHQFNAVGPGQHHVQQDEVGFLLLDEAEHLIRIAGHNGGVACVR